MVSSPRLRETVLLSAAKQEMANSRTAMSADSLHGGRSFPGKWGDIVSAGCAQLQQEFHVERARIRIGAVGRDFLESELAVHGDGIFHDGLDGVEAHAAVADLAGLGEDAVGEDASQALTPELRTEVETLHLADVGVEFVQGDAGRQLSFIFSEQKAPVGRGVVTREMRKFGFEILEAEAEAQGLRIFQKKFTGLGDVVGGRSLMKDKIFHR